MSPVDSVTLWVVSPETADVSMSLTAGDTGVGTWQGSFAPSQSGVYTYYVSAHSAGGASAKHNLYPRNIRASSIIRDR